MSLEQAFVALSVLAVATWFYTAVQFVALLKHRKPDVSLASLLTGGMKAFDPRWFTPEGRRYQKRLVWGMLCFGALGLAIALVVAAGIAVQG